MSGLREVLATFEAGDALSVSQVSARLNIDAGVLESMLEFWVHKGRLRHATYSGCAECGVNHTCPVLVAVPRRYELAGVRPEGTMATTPCSINLV